MHPSARPYADRRIALLTQHGKERVIAPALEPGLGCTIEHVSGFDTDPPGTFTRETARAGPQLDAARRKARKGMDFSGLDAAAWPARAALVPIRSQEWRPGTWS